MITVILHDLTHWYSSTHTSFPFDSYPQDAFLRCLQQASQEQKAIGWNNFLRGRVASTWYQAHDIYHAERRLHGKYSSTSLAPHLVTQLWNISRAFWQHRNEAVHGKTFADAQITQQALLTAKIQHAYTTQEAFNQQDKDLLFTLPLEERLTTTQAAQLQWFALYNQCLTAPPEPTDTPPPSSQTLHNFFRRFAPRYFSTPVHNAAPARPLNHVNNPPQQPANPTP